jgi:predicted PurR-regulated permease PerM
VTSGYGSERVSRNEPAEPRVDHRVAWLAAYSWRLLIIAAAVLAALWVMRLLAPVLVPAVIALFLTRLLTPVNEVFRRRIRIRHGLAAAATMLVLIAGLVGFSFLIVPPIADEASTLGLTLQEALDDVEDWLVETFDVSRGAIENLRSRAADEFRALLNASEGRFIDGATFAAEIVAGLFLALLLTFFMLRDGASFAGWAMGRLRPDHHERARRAAARGWYTLGAYLRGAALLGIVESIAIGLALLFAGGSLVVPVMILTFFAAFVPIVGAITAGVVAVLVALVTGGVGSAAIVAIVAIAVQQLDNDVLAPWIYGRALTLYPVVILVSVVAGGALFGIAGTLLAVPVVAVAVNVFKELTGPEVATA